MKIIQVISQLGNGGAEKLIVELSNQLSKDNEIILISFRDIQEWMFFPKKLRKNIKLIELHKRKGFTPNLIYRLIKIVKEERPDVVHIHLISTLKYFLFIIPLFRRVKYIYTIHSNFNNGEDRKIFNSKLNFIKDIEFVTLSQTIKSEFSREYPHLKFSVINNGISHNERDIVEEEINSYKLNDKTKFFLFVGRLNVEKNIPLLLDTFNSLKDENIKLLMIGKDTTSTQEIYNSVMDNKNPNIIYLGAKENIIEYMKHSNALILSSIREGLPIVVLEALMVGLPIISTPVGGLVEIIEDKKNGFLAKDISEEALLEAINLFLNLKDKEVEKIKENNISLFKEKYSIEKCASSYIKLYNKEKI